MHSQACCLQAFRSVPGILTARCYKSAVDATKKSLTWTVRITAFANGYENNLHSHDGNPSINKFACSTDGVTAAASGTPSCVIALLDPTLHVRGVYTGSTDSTLVVEVLDDDAVPNTYRYVSCSRCNARVAVAHNSLQVEKRWRELDRGVHDQLLRRHRLRWSADFFRGHGRPHNWAVVVVHNECIQRYSQHSYTSIDSAGMGPVFKPWRLQR